jgi:hypothetical protein
LTAAARPFRAKDPQKIGDVGGPTAGPQKKEKTLAEKLMAEKYNSSPAFFCHQFFCPSDLEFRIWLRSQAASGSRGS